MFNKKPEDMDQKEFKETFARVIADSIIKDGFQCLPGLVQDITYWALHNKVFGGEAPKAKKRKR